ncbi:hypothetical protein [Empedobacter brevis]|uniref:hypothetical protein n=1 Tax=Empedobacter brevis TaxID=247 RepID=UPI0028D0293A|nr:hypothetical protein [Empedobacter brevis]
MVEIFITKQGSEIPPKSKDSGHEKLDFSDYFVAKIKCLNGEIKLSLVTYDFKKERWSCVRSGLEKVIEYYIVDENFNSWIKTVNNIDLDLLHEMYYAMDEEDK